MIAILPREFGRQSALSGHRQGDRRGAVRKSVSKSRQCDRLTRVSQGAGLMLDAIAAGCLLRASVAASRQPQCAEVLSL